MVSATAEKKLRVLRSNWPCYLDYWHTGRRGGLSRDGPHGVCVNLLLLLHFLLKWQQHVDKAKHLKMSRSWVHTTNLSRVRMDRRADRNDIHFFRWQRVDYLSTWHFQPSPSCRHWSSRQRSSAAGSDTWRLVCLPSAEVQWRVHWTSLLGRQSMTCSGSWQRRPVPDDRRRSSSNDHPTRALVAAAQTNQSRRQRWTHSYFLECFEVTFHSTCRKKWGQTENEMCDCATSR